jgi:polysaccharide biosynthesis protein PelF
MNRENKSKNTVDICLLLESTYPYVRGGVSSWMHQLITGLPEFTFAVFFIGSTRADYGDILYKLPDNVVDLQSFYIMEKNDNLTPPARKVDKVIFSKLEKMHANFRNQQNLTSEMFESLTKMLLGSGKSSLKDVLFSERGWENIRQSYLKYCDHPSFIEYFWLIRTIHLPLCSLATAVASVPQARIYHSISTGYAGFIGSLLHQTRQKPLILSEHGIYTKERKIDLSQAAWIADQGNLFKTGMDEQVGYLRTISIRFFEALGQMTYAAASPIISLSQTNRKKQIEDGANEKETVVIPNGIKLERFWPIRKERSHQPPPIVGFIGRVVPIKDVKTFIRAIRILCNHLPQAQGWIIGPEDEDQEYADECKTLANNLNLQENLKFLGFQRIDDFLPQLGLLVLTSISEGQPLVILEAFASGLPVIATDVGFCRGMIEGDSKEDCALGSAGMVTPIADPSFTAHAAIELLSDTTKWKAARRVAEKRADQYYDENLLFERYRQKYNEALK